MSQGITDEQRAALEMLAPSLAPETYLAGGVAVALAFGHRTSRDLDLFVPTDFDPERIAERIVVARSDVRIVGTAPGTLQLEVRGVPTSILSYRYPLLLAAEARSDLPVPVASNDDLACMKLSAIAGRGMARDFWDLHVLLAHGAAGGTLASALERYRSKYVADDVGHVVRSLAYFDDADAAPLPSGLDAETWRRIRADFERQVAALD